MKQHFYVGPLLLLTFILVLTIGFVYVGISKYKTQKISLSRPERSEQNLLLGRWNIQWVTKTPEGKTYTSNQQYGFMADGTVRKYDDKGVLYGLGKWIFQKNEVNAVLQIYDWADTDQSMTGQIYNVKTLSKDSFSLTQTQAYQINDSTQDISMTRLTDAQTEASVSIDLSPSDHQKVCEGIQDGNIDFDGAIMLPLTCEINIGHDIHVSLTVTINGSISITNNQGKVIFSKSGDEFDVFNYGGPFLNTDYILFQDVTFDGYSDVVINTGSGAYNFDYSYFEYDTKTGTYNPESIIDAVNPYFDEKTKTIETHDKGRGIGDIYTDDVYTFINGAYILTRTEAQDLDDETSTYTHTISKLKNGKMVQILKEKLSQSDVMGE